MTPDVSKLKTHRQKSEFTSNDKVILSLDEKDRTLIVKRTFTRCNNNGCWDDPPPDMFRPTVDLGVKLRESIISSFNSVYPNTVVEDDSFDYVVDAKKYLVVVDRVKWDALVNDQKQRLSIDVTVSKFNGLTMEKESLEKIKVEFSSSKYDAFSTEEHKGKAFDCFYGAINDLSSRISSYLEDDLRKNVVGKEFAHAKKEKSVEIYFDLLKKYGEYEESSYALLDIVSLIKERKDRVGLFGNLINIHPKAESYVPPEYMILYVGPDGMKIYNILELRKDGFSDKLLASKILSAKAPYKDFSFSEIKQLHQAGLTDELIAAMVQATSDYEQNSKQEKQLEEIRGFQKQQEERRKQQEELERQRQLAAQKKDDGEFWNKAMAIGFGAVAVGAADLPADAAVETFGALTTDIVMETGGSNLQALKNSYTAQNSGQSSGSSSSSKGAKKSKTISFTCPSGVSTTTDFYYRTEACYSAAVFFSKAYACNDINSMQEARSRCISACGTETCNEP